MSDGDASLFLPRPACFNAVWMVPEFLPAVHRLRLSASP
jgi:hypothetical protein